MVILHTIRFALYSWIANVLALPSGIVYEYIYVYAESLKSASVHVPRPLIYNVISCCCEVYPILCNVY